ncbi:hypothetical protein WN48_06922 [Eufriesea mexicana]|uniref:Uncharacterized protein n=1 Tax=Eufriesea mexicana TaxID=516756 RepID=A0A310SI94_9HYME|nr:hypothetical protein WN48_06922 [Eufriesea mexicana]
MLTRLSAARIVTKRISIKTRSENEILEATSARDGAVPSVKLGPVDGETCDKPREALKVTESCGGSVVGAVTFSLRGDKKTIVHRTPTALPGYVTATGLPPLRAPESVTNLRRVSNATKRLPGRIRLRVVPACSTWSPVESENKFPVLNAVRPFRCCSLLGPIRDVCPPRGCWESDSSLAPAAVRPALIRPCDDYANHNTLGPLTARHCDWPADGSAANYSQKSSKIERRPILNHV